MFGHSFGKLAFAQPPTRGSGNSDERGKRTVSSAPAPGPQPKETSSQSARLATILLVDDDPAVLESLRRVLALERWNVVTASSGEAALELLQDREFDLMITDLSMAAVSGWDLLFHENLQRPNLPIFVITALPPSSVGGADRFAHEFFSKPIDLDALLAAVRKYLSGS